MNLKEIKTNAKKNLKINYFKNVIVVFICTILIFGGINYSTKNILDVDITNKENIEVINNYKNKSNSEILDDLLEKTVKEKEYEEYVSNNFTKGVLSIFVNEIVSTKSIVFSLLEGINNFLGNKVSIAMIIIIANVLIYIFKKFFISAFEVGKIRYFLEQRRYKKTNVDRVLYPYKKKKGIKNSIILFIRDLKLMLWTFTIIGVFIKYYEYLMIPYVLAENPNISKKEVFKLSKELMQGNKLTAFKLDLSILGYKLLGFLTFNLFNIFYTNIYIETLYSEFYVNIRNTKYNNLTNKTLLNDNKLYIDKYLDESYPEEINNIRSVLIMDSNKNYSISSYILFFFSFSLIGYIWEVMLHLVNDGVFVNRGTLYGPWLPIYGFGGVFILYLLKSFREKPALLFITSFILCGIIEYTSAWYLETFKHLKYWDYSGYFLNIDGRVCLEGLIVFSLGGCAATYIVAPLLDNLYSKINKNIKTIICIILTIFFTIDFSYSTFIKPNTGKGISSEVKISNSN